MEIWVFFVYDIHSPSISYLISFTAHILQLLDSICKRVPPPEQLSDDDGEIIRAKVIDSWFEVT